MNISKKAGWIVIIILIITACKIPHPQYIEDVLNNLDKNDRKKFEKVFQHYSSPNDSLKLKAAYYLVKYMSAKYSSWSIEEKRYFEVFDSIKKPEYKNYEALLLRTKVNSWIASAEQKFGSIDNKRKNQPDIKTFTSGLLIENIDYAIKVWHEMPWASNVSFIDFCEFILPYRVYDEPLSFWRKELFEKYRWIADTFPKERDPKVVCEYLNNYLAQQFTFAESLGKIPFPSAADMDYYKSGVCEHRYLWVISVMRSIGIPVIVDFTPQYAKWAGTHSWLAVLDTTGKVISFDGGEKNIKIGSVNYVKGDKTMVSKVYRKTYKVPTQNDYAYYPDDFYNSFMNTYYLDVSDEYVYDKASLTIDKNNLKEKAAYNGPLYLCAFGYGVDLVPVTSTLLENDKYHYENLACSTIYVPSIILNSEIIPVYHPNYYGVGNTYATKEVIPGLKNKHKVILTRKYPEQSTMTEFVREIYGGRVQGANRKDFSDAVTILEINEAPNYFKEYQLNNSSNFRFLRYLPADTSKVHLAELEFCYYQNGKRISIQGLPVCNNTSFIEQVKMAFDGNIRTNCNLPSGIWLGIEQTTQNILRSATVRILPRNDLNIIEIGDTYELLYFDYGWKSLGIKVANDNTIEFEDVPDNAILLLHNHSRGKEERIFIYENGKQKWW